MRYSKPETGQRIRDLLATLGRIGLTKDGRSFISIPKLRLCLDRAAMAREPLVPGRLIASITSAKMHCLSAPAFIPALPASTPLG
jgi:hypothetical protein